MVHIKEIHDKRHNYLCVTDEEEDDPKSGTWLTIRSSLRRLGGTKPSFCTNYFLSEMSKKAGPFIKGGSTFYTLRNSLQEKSATGELYPILGRSIISKSVRWGSHVHKLHGDSRFIAGYWEWTEDVLFRFKEVLIACSVYNAVYASLYSYSKDPNVMRAFCESWCPTTNTLHTVAGEFSISLWDLYRLGGLPIVGEIYDETIPLHNELLKQDDQGNRVISRACDHLYGVYHYLAK
ncbi:uncharacterized protein [Spinacia oleracea]|uniref:Aminotransferase-like plant mobile domain-containing protein n=1 Tax=Spinacia oleracea TaxID=3562 RepID=A0ABM3RSW2_SPIOL|nr:uncharacterized protein LOC130472225 [Spinacia oleracea]